MKKNMRRLIQLVLICIFLYSGYKWVQIKVLNYKEKQLNEKMEQKVSIPKGNKKDKIKIDFDALKEINDDIFGWIYLEDTDISYPVVQGKDNEFYLNHTADKQYNYVGSVFLDYRNKKDFSDYNSFIYGHNVKHGTIFAELENYLDKDFFDSHPYIYFFTPEKNYRLEVFSMYSTDKYSDSYQFEIGNDEEYALYLQKIKDRSTYQNDVKVTTEDRIITLSTCSYETKYEARTGRYLVHLKITELNK